MALIGICDEGALRRAVEAYRELLVQEVTKWHRMWLYALEDVDCLQLVPEKMRELESEAGVELGSKFERTDARCLKGDPLSILVARPKS